MTSTATEIQRRFIALDAKDAAEDSFTLSFSSETPVAQHYGDEVLSHRDGAADLSRLNDSAPLLFNHQVNELLGVVERAVIENGKGRAVVRWGTSPEAEAKRKDVAAGVLRNVSVGYSIDEAESDDQGRTLVTRWTPVEISLVSLASDPNVGIGRSHPAYSTSKEPMSYVTDALEPQITRGEYQHEARQFSIVEAAKGIISGRGLIGREAEVNQEIERQTGRRTQGFFVPQEGQWSKRAYTVGTATAGGNLVEAELLAGNFIEALRTRTAIGELGATFLPGLTGDVAIPRRSGDATAYWIGADNADSITESTGTFDQVTMSPKTIGCYCKFSHLMKLQSTPEIEFLIRSNFIKLLAEGVDSAAIEGSGSNSQPKGILNWGIGSVAGGTNGAACDFADFIDLKKEVSVDNADVESCAFLTNSKVEAAIHKLADSNGDYILSPYGTEVGKQQILSRKFVVSNNVPSDLTKGSGTALSAIIYGNFKEVLIGMWGSLEILVDPYTDFAKGTTGIRALQSVDVNLAHLESFAAMQDAIAA